MRLRITRSPAGVSLAPDCISLKPVVDDALVIKVKHADGTTSSYSHDYSQGCIGLSGEVPTNPVDMSSLFQVGVNTITFSFQGCMRRLACPTGRCG